MVEWFIIALVSFAHTDKIEIKQMTNMFPTQEACKQYLRDTPDIVNDILKLEPNNNGISFVCVDQKEIKRLSAKRKSV